MAGHGSVGIETVKLPLHTFEVKQQVGRVLVDEEHLAFIIHIHIICCVRQAIGEEA